MEKALKDLTNRRKANGKNKMKKFIIEGKVYIGRSTAAEKYDVSTSTDSYRVNSIEYSEWKYNE